MADKVDDGYPPQGWYPDPEDSSYLRRWDGSAWTDERVPASRGRRRLRAHDNAAVEHHEAPAPTSDDLDAELARRQAELDRLVEREQGLTLAVDDRRAELDHIAEREDELVQRIADARGELARIEEQVEAAGEAERRLAELTAAEEAATQQLEQRKAELAEFDRETVEAQRVAEAELAGLRAAVEEAHQEQAAAVAQVEETARQLEEIAGRREELAREHEELGREHTELTRHHAGMVAEFEELTRLYEDLSRRHGELAGELEARRTELGETEASIAAARTELVDLGERVAAQDLGLYDYRHPAEDSVALATQLAALRESIVETLRAGEAITAPKNFKLGHSSSKGQQVVAEVTALSLRAYNAEAENAVRTAGPGGIDGALTRLIRAREAVARHGAWIGVTITDRYHALRAQEIEMAGEHRIRKEREEAAAAAAARTTAGGAVPPGYTPGDGREYVPGTGPGYGSGAPGYGTGPGYGAGYTAGSVQEPSAPVTSNGRFSH